VTAPVICEQAADGNLHAAREIFDRTDGRPRQSLGVEIEPVSLRDRAERVAEALGIPVDELSRLVDDDTITTR